MAKTISTRVWIVFGYLLIILLIGDIAYIWNYEWQKVESLESGNRQIDKFRKVVNSIYIHLVEFSLLGETVLDWEDKDLEYDHAQRMVVDGMLCGFKAVYPSHRIDSLRCLLEDKENQMRSILEVLDEQEALNAKIEEPVIARKSTQDQPKKPKRKGFLGLFGKKEESKPSETTTMLYTLNRDVITRQQMQSRRLAEQADSFAARNAELN